MGYRLAILPGLMLKAAIEAGDAALAMLKRDHMAPAASTSVAQSFRADLMYCMHLEPGDLQLLSNQTALHSRTRFEDHVDEGMKRTLDRIWLATPDSHRLPTGWEGYYGTREAGRVRGGSKVHHYDAACVRFDAEQARVMGMSR